MRKAVPFILIAFVLSLAMASMGAEFAPLAKKDASPKAPAVTVDEIVGSWTCTSSTMINGLQLGIQEKVDYARGGSSVGAGVLRLSKDGAGLEYMMASTGTWKLDGNKICETIGQFQIKPSNKAASSESGQQILGGLRALFQQMVSSGKAECTDIIKHDPRNLAFQSPKDKSQVTSCSR